MGELTPREEAEIEAKKTYVGFLKASKYTFYGALAFFFAVASCNFGVEDGPVSYTHLTLPTKQAV